MPDLLPRETPSKPDLTKADVQTWKTDVDGECEAFNFVIEGRRYVAMDGSSASMFRDTFDAIVALSKSISLADRLGNKATCDAAISQIQRSIIFAMHVTSNLSDLAVSNDHGPLH